MSESARIWTGPVEAPVVGARKLVFVPGGEAVLVLNLEGQYFALENSCPHAGASIAQGVCEQHTISCPAHGLRFDVRSGACTASPGLRIPTYDVVHDEGQLWIALSERGGP